MKETSLSEEDVLLTYPLLPADFREESIKQPAFEKTHRMWACEKPDELQQIKRDEKNIDQFEFSFTFSHRTIYPGYERLVPRVEYHPPTVNDEWQRAMQFGYNMAEEVKTCVREIQAESELTRGEWTVLLLYSRFDVPEAAKRIGVSPDDFRTQLYTVHEKANTDTGCDIYDLVMSPEELDYAPGESQMHV